jgi:hypothetical protein
MDNKEIEALLHEYFIQNGSITIPGVGTFRMQRISAQVDFASRKMLPPSYTIRYDHRHDSAHRELFDYFAMKSGLPELEAIKQVNNYAYDLKDSLLKGRTIPLEGFGKLLPDNGSGFQFEADRLHYEFIPGVTAERVIRLDSEHQIRVGDEQKTSSEMEAILSEEVAEPGLWDRFWFRALCLASLALLLIALRAFNGGFSLQAPRQDKVVPADPAPTYQIQKQP